MNKIVFNLEHCPHTLVVALDSLSNTLAGLDEGIVKSVWPHLTEEERNKYLKDTHNSKMQQQPADAPTTAGESQKVEADDSDDSDDSKKDWWDKLDSDEQAAYLERHPRSKRRKTHVKGVAKQALLLASNKVHRHTKKLGRHFRWGMKGLRALRAGKPLTPGQSEGMKKVAGVVAGLAIASLVGLALFTPLAGFAVELGQEYLDHIRETAGAVSGSGFSMSADASVKDDDKMLEEFQKGLHEWLVAQDPKALADKYRANKAKA